MSSAPAETEEAVTFDTPAGLTAAWRTLRGQILEAHGYAADAPNIRLASGLLVLDVRINGQWFAYTDGSQLEMRDRVRQGGTFRLRPRAPLTVGTRS